LKCFKQAIAQALFLCVAIGVFSIAYSASDRDSSTISQSESYKSQGTDNTGSDSKSMQLSIDSPVTSSIEISSPTSYQAFQKNKNNRQNIVIKGTYTGNPKSISASFNGGKPQIITPSPKDGSFSGTLSNQAAGQGELKVWFTNDSSRITTRIKVAITDVYALIGQSNQTEVDADFKHSTPKTYSMPSSMGPLVFNASSKRSAWNDAAMNSTYVVQFGQDYFDKHGYPCAFIFSAVGGTNLASWQPDSDYSYNSLAVPGNVFGIGLNLYNRAKSMIQIASPTGVKAFLWHQGEADAGTLSDGNYRISAAKETAQLQAIAKQLNIDFPGAPMLVAKLQIIRTQAGAAIDTSTVHEGQMQAWGSMPNLLQGPDFSDLECEHESFGYFHLMNDQTVTTVGHRWFKACLLMGLA
jgi:Carbohydrate esterase, sialic acid-specific acetylesterase